MTFSSLNLHPAVIDHLPGHINAPTLIQQQAIPAILKGRDLLALAQTGSGKTMAFGLPLLHCVIAEEDTVQAVVLVPTRELASQVHEALLDVAQGMGIRLVTLCGGVAQEQQLAELALKPQLIIATPGRLLDFLKQGVVSLNTVKQLVLDEADRLLEMGFWPDIQRLLTFIPAQRQTLLFSATLPTVLDELAMGLLQSPKRVEAHASNTVVDDIEERLYLVNKGSKAQALIALLEENPWSQVLVFISARDSADALAKKLTKAGLSVAALHGEKEQAVRTQTLADFKAGKIRVLVATDLLARGIDVEALPVVVNLDLPPSAPVYVHRVGRTARAGRGGLAISLVCHQEDETLKAIRTLTGRELTLGELADFPVTDKPASGERKRPPRDKQANRRSAKKRTARQFKSKGAN